MRRTVAAAAVATTLALAACGGGGGPGPTAGPDEGTSPENTWTPTPGGDGGGTTSPDEETSGPEGTTSPSSTPTTSTPAGSSTPTSTRPSSSTPTDTGTPFDLEDFTSRLEQAVEDNPTVTVEVRLEDGGQEGASGQGVQDLANEALAMDLDVGGQEFGYRVVGGRTYLAQPPKWVPVTEDSTNPLVAGALEQVKLLNMRRQLDAFVAGAESVGDQGFETVGGVRTRHYTATVETATMHQELGLPTDAGAPRTVTYDVWLDGDDLIRQLTFTRDGATATLSASKWGEPVQIDEPKGSEIARVPDPGTS